VSEPVISEVDLNNYQTADLLLFEKILWNQGIKLIAGVDEAGRGPLAGPVVAAAVIFPMNISLTQVTDSKKLTPRQREKMFAVIHEKALAVGIGAADHQEIDRLNILQATFLAMNRALTQLQLVPDHLLIDGNQLPANDFPKTALVKGDNRSLSIAAASIVAKVSRDRLMTAYHQYWPQYGFGKHKGYPTQTHIQAIHKYGLSPIHRRTFRVKPVDYE